MGFSHVPTKMATSTYDSDGDQLVDVAEGIRETGGPTTLTAGAVADAQVLARSGTTYAGLDRAGIDTDATADLDVIATVVTTAAGLVTALGAASAGDTVRMAAGTYTLTSVTGALDIPSGVTLEGAGIDQTIITQDGTLADDLIQILGTFDTSYGVGAIAQWATSATMDTAAEAANILDGQPMQLVDPASGERFTTYAVGDGNPGTGVFNFAHEVPVAFGATTTVQAFSAHISNVTLRGFTIAAEAVGTDMGLNVSGARDIVIEDIHITGPGSANTEPALGFTAVVGGRISNLRIDGYDYRGLLQCTEVDIDMVGVGGSGSPDNRIYLLNRCNYNKFKLRSHGGAATRLVQAEIGHRSEFVIISTDNVTDALEMNNCDDNVYHVTARGAVDDNGTGNVGDAT